MLERDSCGVEARVFARGSHRRLDFRPPLAWESLLAYLRLRAVPGVEWVNPTHYRRTVQIGVHGGWIAVSRAADGAALELEICDSLAPVADAVAESVTHLFDLRGEPDAVRSVLSRDPALAVIVQRLPGLRVPGAFDGFELAVRAILGQQVSVKSATTLAGRWARAFGRAIHTPFAELDRVAPTAEMMAAASEDAIGVLGIIGSRARSIVAVASAVTEGAVRLSPPTDGHSSGLQAPHVHAQIEALRRLPGIGPWTAHYIAMRALHWADAFPGTDLMLLRAANASAKELAVRAEAWRPWRAYATHYLWQSLGASA
jgi:AraC family transcriptional regulator of adaptative response / DNA-3-methyladenine glycosylase II